MIVVVGSLNLDLVVRVPRLPHPGETLLGTGYEEHAGGKGANQALAAARAGGRVAMVGRVGRDAAGARLRSGLAQEGVDVGEVHEVDAPTGRALIEVDAAGENRIVVVPGANGGWDGNDLPSDLLRRADVVLLQREIPDAVVAEAVRQVAGAGGRAVLNVAPAGRVAPEVLAEVGLLLANASETALLLGDVDPNAVAADPVAAAERLSRVAGCEVAITLGPGGAAYASAQDAGHVPAFPVRPVDTTGAGDAFAGALAVRMAEGAGLADAVRFACAAGAESVLQAGAQPSLPHRERIRDRMATLA